jgi:hypothetical protein
VGTFGWGVAGRIDYATRWGIILNTERVEQRRAVSFLTGMSVALGKMKIDKSWFDAIANTAEEAEAEFNVHEARERQNSTSRQF